MLALSAVIATAGVLADSTATVIGAMIIAPLSTPIMGIALGIAKRDPERHESLGALRARGRRAGDRWSGSPSPLLLPGSFDLLGNTQIAGRTSPGLLDLIAAVATGFAGAVALARRDVAAVLPGVAIAISLVPPLAVVGVCLGQGSIALAIGALVLFVSNLLALVLAGTLVFTAVGYTAEAEAEAAAPQSRRKAYLTISLLLVVVIIPLAANTLGAYLVSVWTERVQVTAEQWISAVPDATIQGVDFASNEVIVRVQTPGDLPPVEELVADLEGEIPNGIPIAVTTSVGQLIQAGTVGGD